MLFAYFIAYGQYYLKIIFINNNLILYRCDKYSINVFNLSQLYDCSDWDDNEP